MDAVALFVAIARNIGVALLNPEISGGKTAEWVGYLNLAAFLAERFADAGGELQLLNDQIQEAVDNNRGLTAEQRAEWRRRDDLATDIAERWLAEHPEE